MSRIIYGVFSSTTGRLERIEKRATEMPSLASYYAPERVIAILPTASWDYWLDITTTPHTLHQKTAHPLTIGATTIDADGEDECLITGVHNPSTVTWPDGFIETVTDGEVRFSVDLAGEYAITIEAIPYLKETVNVQALPAN